MYQLDFDEFLIANGFGNEAVEYLRQSFERRQSLPMEVMSGKDFRVHSALDNLMAVSDYHIAAAVVLSNDREIKTKGNVLYLPIYHLMFLENKIPEREDLFFSFGYCIF